MNKVGDVILGTAFTAEASRSQYLEKMRLYKDTAPITRGVKTRSFPDRILVNMETKSVGAESVIILDTLFGAYHALWDYCHICGIERTGVHRFRHTFAKKWVTMGGSVVTLQKILGHSSLDITENYLNILTTDLKKDMDEINIIRSLKQEHIKMRKAV